MHRRGNRREMADHFSRESLRYQDRGTATKVVAVPLFVVFFLTRRRDAGLGRPSARQSSASLIPGFPGIKITSWMEDTPMSELKRTQLYDLHVAAGATMVDFGG